MVELLDNFLNPLKLFLGCGERFNEIVITENGRGMERKINGGPAMVNQVGDGWKQLTQKYLQTESTIKNFKSHNLSEEPIARYLRFPEIIYSQSIRQCLFCLVVEINQSLFI